MTPQEEQEKVALLTTVERKTYDRIRQGEWYHYFDHRGPAALGRLLELGLIKTGGRVAVTKAAAVPWDYVPYMTESWRGYIDRLDEEVVKAIFDRAWELALDTTSKDEAWAAYKKERWQLGSAS